MSTRELTFAQAIREALDEELARDSRIVVMGEDVGAWGGVFRTTEGLFQKYGPERVIDTPLSEEGFVGLAVGAAMTGMHPVAEIMFGDFITLVMDQIVNQAAKMRYMSGGRVKVADFGIAQAFTEVQLTLTQPGMTMGSVHYFSPEQARDEVVTRRLRRVRAVGPGGVHERGFGHWG